MIFAGAKWIFLCIILFRIRICIIYVLQYFFEYFKFEFCSHLLFMLNNCSLIIFLDNSMIKIFTQDFKTKYFECIKYFWEVITNKNNLLWLWIIKCHNSKHVVKNINKWWISSNDVSLQSLQKMSLRSFKLMLVVARVKIGQTLEIFRLCTKNFNTVIPLKTFIFASHL